MVGILHVVAGNLASARQRFAVVVRNRAIGDVLARELRAYGLGAALTGVDALDVGFSAIAEPDGWSAAMQPLLVRLAAGGTRIALYEFQPLN